MESQAQGILCSKNRFLAYAAKFLLLLSAVKETETLRKSFTPDNCGTGARDGSFLWRVDTSPPSYFFGTIHVPYDRVWPHVPANTKQAFHQADAVFFELALTDAATVSALTQCQRLPRGTRLQQLLPPKLYQRLQQHLNYVRTKMPQWMSEQQRDSGLVAEYLFQVMTGDWAVKRPVWVMLMLNTLTESDVRSRGVPVLDLFLALEAQRRGQRTGAVERVEEQCLPLNGLDMKQVVFALNRTLNQHEGIRSGVEEPAITTEDLIHHYNCGDLDRVIYKKNSSSFSAPGFPVPPLAPVAPTAMGSTSGSMNHYFISELIFKRNRRMGKRIIRLLRENPHTAFFFAFGAGHFIGNFTVLDVLREAGYRVTRVAAQQQIQRYRGRAKLNSSETSVNNMIKQDNGLWSGDGAPTFNDASEVLSRGVSPRNSGEKYKENFSDLWVKIDEKSQREEAASATDGSAAADADGDSVRVWFGLLSGRSPHASAAPQLTARTSVLLYLLLLSSTTAVFTSFSLADVR